MSITKRVGAVCACFIASTGCGTLYVYSAYSTQLADRLDLSATQSSILGMMGPFGVAFLSAVAGYCVDRFGLLIPCIMGTCGLGIGYSYVYFAYEYAWSFVPAIALALVLSGFGSTLTYAACIKAAALNFPHARGAATSVPMSAFGLSAFVFSTLAGVVYPGDTLGFLKILWLLTTGLSLFCTPFIRVHHNDDVKAPPDPEAASVVATVTPKNDDERSRLLDPTGESNEEGGNNNSYTSEPGNNATEDPDTPEMEEGGLTLLRDKEFWKQFLIMGLLSGPGQMYIYCVGYCVRALARYSDMEHSPARVQTFQAIQVGLISVTNFGGRLLSGFTSDLLLHKYGLSRFWMLFAASSVMLIGNILALNLIHVHHIWVVSAVVGISYGLIYGVYPSIISDLFGMNRFSSNWGLVSITQVISSYIFSVIFGKIYDSNSVKNPDGPGMICNKGHKCYQPAFILTTITCVITMGYLLLFIRQRYRQHSA